MIYIIGEILIDTYKDKGLTTRYPGGAPFNVASNLSLLGNKCKFFGAVGNDCNGKFLKEYAKRLGLSRHIRALKNKDTTVALVENENGERTFKFLRDNGADYCLSLSQIKKVGITSNDIVHIGSLMLSKPRGKRFFLNLVHYVHSKGALVSFDANYRDDIYLSSRTAKNVTKFALANSDIIKLSKDELDILSRKKRTINQLKELISSSQIAFVTLGKDGSLIYKDGKINHADSIEVNMIDSTGAGDAFYSYILKSFDDNPNFIKEQKLMNDVLKKANIIGALTTEHKGAKGSIVSEKELNNIIK